MLFCRQSGTGSVLVQAIENNSCWKVSSFSSTRICRVPLPELLVRGASYRVGEVCVRGRPHRDLRPTRACVCCSLGATRNSAGQLQAGSEKTSTLHGSGLELESEILSLSWEEKHPWAYTLWRGAGPEVEGLYLMASAGGRSGLLTMRKVRDEKGILKKDFK